jgi:hypothetical protein
MSRSRSFTASSRPPAAWVASGNTLSRTLLRTARGGGEAIEPLLQPPHAARLIAIHLLRALVAVAVIDTAIYAAIIFGV